MNELRDVAKIQVGSDIIPNVMSNQVVPVIDVNPKHARIINYLKAKPMVSNFTSSTIDTTPSGNIDIYLVSATLSAKFHTGGTATYVSLRIFVDTLSIDILSCCNFAGDGTTGSQTITFPIPIKIDRNSTIRIISDVAELSTCASATIQGFIVSNPNA